jgi:hypothetical protein
MANKTLYVRDADLALWETAQLHLGQSVSALFSEFLRERVKITNVFVHVLRSAPNSEHLAVLFSPVEPLGSGGPASPHYIEEPKLVSFLEKCGVTRSMANKVASNLKSSQSVSELTTITKRRSAMAERFEAGTQYGDWKGTAAADGFNGLPDRFDELFEATGEVDPEREIMIGFAFYYSEGMFFCCGHFHPVPENNGRGYYPSLNAKFQNDQINPIKVKKVNVELTLEEFFKYFKRFHVVLLNGTLDINDREYEVIE